MASQLLTFNPAFMRRRGGGEPTGTEPMDVHAVNRIVLLSVAADAQFVHAVNRLVLLESP